MIQADAGGIPQVSALYEKATKQRVHRFRKPLRDARARARRQLAAECERLAADVKTWESSANLTAVGEAERSAVGTDIAALRASLDALGGAARNGRNASMQSAYAQAVNAYGRIRSKIDFTAQ